MSQSADNDDEWTPPAPPYWLCQECGHADHNKPMPADKVAFYARPFPPKCPRCKSEAFVPSGW